MKIYLAGKWEERDRISTLMNVLISHGHEITCDWTTHESNSELHEHAIADIKGVQDADIYIVLAKRNYNYRGAFCELGAALALNKLVFVIGNAMDSCIFINHPLVTKVESLKDVLEVI